MFLRKTVGIIRNVVEGGVDKSYQTCKFECDSASDLPAKNQTDYVIDLGSEAHDVSTNAKYMIKSDGTWVLQNPDGTAGYTKEEIDALIEGAEDYADSAVTTGINALDASTVGGTTRYIYQISQTNGKISAYSYATDTTPTAGSTKLVQSKGVKDYVDTAETNAKADWFLLGTQISAATAHANNLNNYKTPGHYYIASNTTAGNVDNTPVNYAGKLNVELISNDTNYIRQTYFANTDSTALISVRRYKGVDPDTQEDIWSEWVTFPTPANVIGMILGTTNATVIPSAGVNLDTLTTPGVWISGSTTGAQASSGRPNYANAGSKIFRLEVKSLSSTRPIQEMYVYRIGTSEGEFAKYQRMSKTNGTWNDWQQVNATDVGTYYPPAQQSLSPQVMSVNPVNLINEVDEVIVEETDDEMR